MRVLLVNPESEVWSSRKHIPLGLGYLASSLRENGHEPYIFDMAVEDEPLAAEIERAEEAGRPYHLVGITATTPLIEDAWKAARTVKKYGLPTLLGGPHLMLLPLESMERPEVDFVLQGEAEFTIVELVDALEHGKDLGRVPGLFWRKDGNVVVNPPAPLVEDLDSIPFPAHDLYKIEKYTNLQPLTDGLDKHARSYTIITSRGCPYHCTYCSKPITGDTWRGRSVDNIIEEWRWLVKGLGATEIGVTDDIWNLKRDRAKELCRRLIEEGLNTVPWVTVHGMKVNNTDQELFHLMKAAGCKRVGFGVESGDPWILKHVIKKSQTLDMVRDAFRWAKTAGLQTMGFFIFGMPHETEETMERTIQFALELDPDLANFMLAAPFPGTELWNMVVESGGQVMAQNWQDLAIHSDHARFVMPGYDPELVVRKWKEAYRRFYLYRPKRVWQKITRKDLWLNMPETLRNMKRFFFPSHRKAAA